MSDQGFWNRAGRRSGGYRPQEIVVAPTIDCSCGTSTPLGLLPKYSVEDHTAAVCPKCRGILMVEIDGRWVTANEIRESSAVSPHPDQTSAAR